MQTRKLSLFKLNIPPDGKPLPAVGADRIHTSRDLACQLTSPPETVSTVAAVSAGINKIDLSRAAG